MTGRHIVFFSLFFLFENNLSTYVRCVTKENPYKFTFSICFWTRQNRRNNNNNGKIIKENEKLLSHLEEKKIRFVFTFIFSNQICVFFFSFFVYLQFECVCVWFSFSYILWSNAISLFHSVKFSSFFFFLFLCPKKFVFASMHSHGRSWHCFRSSTSLLLSSVSFPLSFFSSFVYSKLSYTHFEPKIADDTQLKAAHVR